MSEISATLQATGITAIKKVNLKESLATKDDWGPTAVEVLKAFFNPERSQKEFTIKPNKYIIAGAAGRGFDSNAAFWKPSIKINPEIEEVSICQYDLWDGETQGLAIHIKGQTNVDGKAISRSTTFEIVSPKFFYPGEENNRRNLVVTVSDARFSTDGPDCLTSREIEGIFLSGIHESKLIYKRKLELPKNKYINMEIKIEQGSDTTYAASDPNKLAIGGHVLLNVTEFNTNFHFHKGGKSKDSYYMGYAGFYFFHRGLDWQKSLDCKLTGGGEGWYLLKNVNDPIAQVLAKNNLLEVVLQEKQAETLEGKELTKEQVGVLAEAEQVAKETVKCFGTDHSLEISIPDLFHLLVIEWNVPFSRKAIDPQLEIKSVQIAPNLKVIEKPLLADKTVEKPVKAVKKPIDLSDVKFAKSVFSPHHPIEDSLKQYLQINGYDESGNQIQGGIYVYIPDIFENASNIYKQTIDKHYQDRGYIFYEIVNTLIYSDYFFKGGVNKIKGILKDKTKKTSHCLTDEDFISFFTDWGAYCTTAVWDDQRALIGSKIKNFVIAFGGIDSLNSSEKNQINQILERINQTKLANVVLLNDLPEK